MKSLKLVLSRILVCSMAAFLLGGCAKNTASPTAASTANPTAGSTRSGESVYTTKKRTALDGLTMPQLSSRANIEKALPKSKKSHLKIGWSEGTMSTPFFVQMVKGAKAEAEKYGYTLIVDDANSNVTKQGSDMEDLITQNCDAIVINAISADASAVSVRKTVEAGIPCVGNGLGFDSSVPVITSILGSNYEEGYATGQYVAETFKGKPIKAAAIMARQGNPISESRTNGEVSGILEKRYEEAGKPFKTREDAMNYGLGLYNQLLKAGKINDSVANLDIVALGEAGDWSADAALKTSQDILTAHSDINVALVETDTMATGVVTAIGQRGLVAGKDVQVAANVYGSKSTMELVKSGKLLCTGYSSPDQMGGLCIDLLHKIFEEGYDANNMPAITTLPIYSITQSNVDEFYDANLAWAKVQPFTFKTIGEINQANQACSSQ